MNDLVKLVAKKTGMSEAIAQIAVTTVVSSLKTKLPANVAGILDAVAGTGTQSSSARNDNPLGNLGNVVSGLGSLLGKK